MHDEPRRSEGLTYRDAGVDIDAGDALVAAIRPAATRSHSDRVLRGIGHFGGFYRVGPAGGGATLVASIDGVGTKLMVAQLANHHAGVGYDIVHHCINDILACGARPLCFLDYYGTGRLNVTAAATVIGGIADACARAGVALLGGETAEMPGLYQGEDYDLVGTIIGMIDEDDIIDGQRIQAQDVVLGLPSSGFHTNGFSLVRAALQLTDDADSRARLAGRPPWGAGEGKTLASVLLEPHHSYLAAVQQVLADDRVTVHGMAHITGGGIPGNLARIIPDGMQAVIDTNHWNVPAAMAYVGEVGHIPEMEQFRAFNMGIGYIIVVPEAAVAGVQALVPDAMVIGTVSGTRSDVDTPVVLLQDGRQLT